MGQHDIKSENLGSECIFIALQDYCKGANLDEMANALHTLVCTQKAAGGQIVSLHLKLWRKWITWE